MNEDTPEYLCIDLLARAFYGKENYGRNILGPAKNVKAFTVADILAYKKKRYCPENIVISFAGGIDMQTAQALVETYFGDLEKGEFEKRTVQIIGDKKSLVKTKPIEQMHIGIAYPTVNRYDKTLDAVNAVNGVLGGTMSARLFQEVREKRGLAYSVYSYVSTYSECGIQAIYAGVNPTQAEEAYEAILNVVKDMKEKGITEDEFLRSREQMKASTLFSNESSNSQMLLYGKYMLHFNEVYDFPKRLDEINALTYKQALTAIEQMFDDKQKAIALVGNTDKAFKL
jgi:predicted Zn-dependent peptidase